MADIFDDLRRSWVFFLLVTHSPLVAPPTFVSRFPQDSAGSPLALPCLHSGRGKPSRGWMDRQGLGLFLIGTPRNVPPSGFSCPLPLQQEQLSCEGHSRWLSPFAIIWLARPARG